MNAYYENKIFRQLHISAQIFTGDEFQSCRFENCTADQCILNGCHFQDCTFTDCRFSTLTSNGTATLSCDFSDCLLSGIHWGTFLGGGYLMPIHSLQNCQLKYNDFSEMNFNHFDFTGNSVLSSLFAACKLKGSIFYGCPLEQTEFFQCDLTGADFRQAQGYQINITANTVKKARFSLPEACSLLSGLGILLE